MIDRKDQVTPAALLWEAMNLRYTGREHGANVMRWAAEIIEELEHVLGAIEHGIRFEWEDHTGEVSSGVEKLINNWKEKRDAG